MQQLQVNSLGLVCSETSAEILFTVFVPLYHNFVSIIHHMLTYMAVGVGFVLFRLCFN